MQACCYINMTNFWVCWTCPHVDSSLRQFVPPSPLLSWSHKWFPGNLPIKWLMSFDCQTTSYLLFLIMFSLHCGQSPCSHPRSCCSLSFLGNLFIEYQHDVWENWNDDNNLGCMQYKHGTNNNVESGCVVIYCWLFIHSLLLSFIQ